MNIPIVAGDVPVEFVVVLEETQAVADAVMKRDVDGVLRAGTKIFSWRFPTAAVRCEAELSVSEALVSVRKSE
jgi:hypothetical protein